MMAEYERLCAVICSIKDIIDSEYKEMPGWEPNYVKLHSRIKASRFNLIGTVIDVNLTNPFTMIIDDGTGQIEVRSVDEVHKTPSVGETVIVVGRPRKYNEKTYLMSELIKIIDNTSWIIHRKKHIELLKNYFSKLPIIKDYVSPTLVKEETEIKNTVENNDDYSEEQEKEAVLTDSEKIYNMINELDKGDGAKISLILERCQKESIQNAEKSIQLMLEMGDIFEIKSGRVKIL
jgi:hypothetical protein